MASAGYTKKGSWEARCAAKGVAAGSIEAARQAEWKGRKVRVPCSRYLPRAGIVQRITVSATQEKGMALLLTEIEGLG